LSDCQLHDFRKLAINGGCPVRSSIPSTAGLTTRRHFARIPQFDRDLVPNVLRGVETVDMSVTVMGQKLAMPLYCSPTALQRLFHHAGEHKRRGGGGKIRHHVRHPRWHGQLEERAQIRRRSISSIFIATVASTRHDERGR
jgi:hypothetical protein